MQLTKRPLFYWILNKYRGLQLFLLLVIIISLFFRVYPLEMQRKIINIAINLKKLELLYLYCGLYMGAVLIAGLMKYYINTLQAIIGQKILIQMRKELYEHILKLPLEFFHKTQAGIIISAMTSELNAIGSFLGGALAIPIASILTFATFLGFMIYLNPTLGIITMLIYPFEFIVIPMLQKRHNVLNRKRVKISRSMASLVNESVSGIHEVQSNGSFLLEQKKLGLFIDKLYKTMRSLFIFKYGIKFSNNFFQSLGPFILFLLGGYLAIHGQFTIGALVAFLSAYEKVYDPWKEIIEYYQLYQDAQIRYKQIMDTFDLEDVALIAAPDREPLTLQGKIEAKDLGFKINQDTQLLEDISFSLDAGKHLALIGYSGSGKSTLSRLISQLFAYSDGSLQIDGVEVKKLSKLDVALNISTVAQHPFIFTGSVRENLLYSTEALRLQGVANSEPEQEEIHGIIQEVGLEPDIIRWGFRTIVSQEKLKHLESKFIQMRNIVHQTLRNDFSSAVEFYDADSFLEYCTIGQNIIFGEYVDETEGDLLLGRRKFRDFLHTINLEAVLYELGKNIATTTITLLRDLREDEFFFQGSPMEPEQFDEYVTLTEKLKSTTIDRLKVKEKDKLLHLALTYIPGKHKIFTISDTLKKTIVETRHRFLDEVEKVNLEQCKDGTIQSEIMPLNQLRPQQGSVSFIPFCSSQYLINQTLGANILFGRIIDRDAIRNKLGELAVNHFSREGLMSEILEIGLDFHVGSKGDNLSGGQKQKVAIARSLLKRSPLLILDEATASLDNASQAKIQNYIEQELHGNTTVIAVVHRLDMISGYDHIIVMKAGKIVESGNYDQLMDQQGELYGLVSQE